MDDLYDRQEEAPDEDVLLASRNLDRDRIVVFVSFTEESDARLFIIDVEV
jgi:hypothetical protein